MMTLRQFSPGLNSLPAITGWYLADLGEARGKQELFLQQAPQKLKALREHALIESAVSSNRIEGIEIDPRRVSAVLLANKPVLRARNEQAVRGDRNALKLIHEQAAKLTASVETILRLHAMCRPEATDAGHYKGKAVDIIETYPDGRYISWERLIEGNKFSVANLQRAYPGVSIDLIRQVLKELRPKVECLGRGRNARWQKKKQWN